MEGVHRDPKAWAGDNFHPMTTLTWQQQHNTPDKHHDIGIALMNYEGSIYLILILRKAKSIYVGNLYLQIKALNLNSEFIQFCAYLYFIFSYTHKQKK